MAAASEGWPATNSYSDMIFVKSFTPADLPKKINYLLVMLVTNIKSEVHQWILWADVVVQPDAPPAAVVVEGRDCIQVCLDPFKVASLLVDCRLRVSVEGKGNHVLANATLPRVSRTGGRVARFWNSRKKSSRNILSLGFKKVLAPV